MVMRLNHIDLQVPDVQESARFFERWFCFALISSPSSPAIAILEGEGGFTLVLQRKLEDEKYPSQFHIGFLRETEEQVVEFQRRAREAGLAVSDLQRNGRGTLSYLHAPGGLLIEVSWHRHPGAR